MYRGLIVTLIVLISAFVGVFGITCYKCNSYTDKNHTACMDPMAPFPQVNATACPSNHVCTRVSYTTQNTFITSRSCDPPGNTCNNIKNNLQVTYKDLSNFKCYFCSKNYCNGAKG